MAMGARASEQQELWVATQDLPKSPGHPFYQRLNRILAEAGFDRMVEDLCEPYYAKAGRPSIPPGVYFRMLLIGYFEGIGSQRGIAWRCHDSFSLKTFLGFGVTDASPDHSSLTYIRKRLPLEVHHRVFLFVLEIAEQKKLLKGKTIAVDATTLEANAAMKSIVLKETGEDWKEYLTRLVQEEEGIEEPTDEDLRRFDKKRKDKKVSNKEWESKTDRDSRVMKMKDGRTHLAYKAEHAIDMETDLVVAAQVFHADEGDPSTLLPTVVQSQVNMTLSGSEAEIEDAVADKGYHKAETLADLERFGLRSYIPEKQTQRRKWTDKPECYQEAYRANRRRVKGNRGKALQRKRSELPERSFAHVCETGGARRTWLRGLEEINKRYLIQVAARNLGLILRRLYGVGTPRSLHGKGYSLISSSLGRLGTLIRRVWAITSSFRPHLDPLAPAL